MVRIQLNKLAFRARVAHVGVATLARNPYFSRFAPLPHRIARMPEGVKALKALKALKAVKAVKAVKAPSGFPRTRNQEPGARTHQGSSFEVTGYSYRLQGIVTGTVAGYR